MTNDNIEAVKNNAKGYLKDGADIAQQKISEYKGEVKSSAKDWFQYIEDHPIQSMIFGVVIFSAIRGLFKD